MSEEMSNLRQDSISEHGNFKSDTNTKATTIAATHSTPAKKGKVELLKAKNINFNKTHNDPSFLSE